MAKRLFDLLAACLSLILLAPVMLVAAVGIRLSSRGPVLYRAQRVGRQGRPFVMFKFRTMRVDAQSPGSVITAAGDHRVFPWGRLLRQLKLDELPQLVNVLRGEMSLIGPRPEDPAIVARYYTSQDRETLAVTPGLASPGSIYNYTHGEALLNGADPEQAYVRELLPVKLALDVLYVRQAGFLYDLRLVLRTLSVLASLAGGRKSFREPPELAAARELVAARPLPFSSAPPRVRIPFAKVLCQGNELKYVQEVIEGGWLTTAGKTLAFEQHFAAAVGAKFACAVNSCTAALHLALEALDVGPGQRVFVPTMTFTATAEVIRYLGADPVFLDVEYGTSLLTPAILADAIHRYPDVKQLMLVHFGGQAAELTRQDGRGILELCRRHGIRLVEDAAHAFPAAWQGRKIGSFGDVTCFSFYANKTLTTGEGGMLVTDNEDLYRRAKVMRLHGIDRDVWNRFTSDKPSWEYDVVAPGFKYNLPDLAAAVGLAQLERADEFRRGRERCARFYLRELAGVPGIDLPALRVPASDHAWHLFPIVLNERATVSRNRFIESLAERGVGTSVHYKPLHRMTYYRQRYGLQPEDYPNAERIWQGCVSLPVYPTLSDEDLEYVCHTIRQTLCSSPAATRRRAA